MSGLKCPLAMANQRFGSFTEDTQNTKGSSYFDHDPSRNVQILISLCTFLRFTNRITRFGLFLAYAARLPVWSGFPRGICPAKLEESGRRQHSCQEDGRSRRDGPGSPRVVEMDVECFKMGVKSVGVFRGISERGFLKWIWIWN